MSQKSSINLPLSDSREQKLYTQLSERISKCPGELIDPTVLSAFMGETPFGVLMGVLIRLAREKKLTKIIKVRSPKSRALLKQDYTSLGEIPDELFDSNNEPFLKDDGEIVIAFRAKK